MKRIIAPKAPAALGPYSHATVLNNTVYVSGQLGIDPETNKLAEGLEAQAHQAMKNLLYILDYSNASVETIAKVTIYLDDMADFKVVNGIYESYLEGFFPARVAIAVETLPVNALFEIDAIAGVKTK